MKWIKKGLIYTPSGSDGWDCHSALQPTPLLINENLLRVFIGCRDQDGVSRVGFVDLNPGNPSEILNIATKPALDIGSPGSFDDNGVVPCAVVRREDEIWLYYAGYQIPSRTKFLAFCGLAISHDMGVTFERYSQVPIMDRTDNELLFRVMHSMLFDQKKKYWQVWYGGGSECLTEGKKRSPIYDIRYCESKDGVTFSNGQICLALENGETRVGRPFVVKTKDEYQMFYAKYTQSESFRLGYAESLDGIEWVRKDEEIGIKTSPDGWDSHMISYPSVQKYAGNTYLFYNGNNYGKDGFGYAILSHIIDG